MKAAICIGHSRLINGRRDGGAVSVDGTNEWTYNIGLADIIEEIAPEFGIEPVVISKYQGSGYASAMQWLAAEIRRKECAAAVELHFNSATPAATGHEWLHWHSSTKGRAMASAAKCQLETCLPRLRSRGIKPIHRGERGWNFLAYTHCPAMIAEPGFGSNTDDWDKLQNCRNDIATAILAALIAVKT